MRGTFEEPPTRLIPWFSKTKGNTYATLAASPSPLRGKPTQAQDVAGPLFYEFIFNLSFDPRLVCPSGFILSPLGSEVMISCHVAFFRVICYNPVLQIKMTTTTPPGHVHEDFSTVIAEVKPAPAGSQKKTSAPLYRQEPPRLLASVSLFTLSRPLQI